MKFAARRVRRQRGRALKSIRDNTLSPLSAIIIVVMIVSIPVLAWMIFRALELHGGKNLHASRAAARYLMVAELAGSPRPCSRLRGLAEDSKARPLVRGCWPGLRGAGSAPRRELWRTRTSSRTTWAEFDDTGNAAWLLRVRRL